MWMPRHCHINGNFTGSATCEYISSDGLVMWKMTWSRQNLTWRQENMTWTRQNLTWRATSVEVGLFSTIQLDVNGINETSHVTSIMFL